MQRERNTTEAAVAADSMAQAVQALVQFARVVRRRKVVVFVAVVICCVLGALYYTATPPLYEARASLLIIPTGSDLWNGTATLDRSQQALMPTYERLFYEDVVLDGAVAHLRSQPRMEAEFGQAPPARWPALLRERLAAQRRRRTNLITIAYRSRRPPVAEQVVSAVVQSYLDFIDRNHRDIAADIVQILDKERLVYEQRLHAKQAELLEINRRVRDLGLHERSEAVHPAVRRVLSLNDQLIEAQQQRLDIQATLATLQNTLESGSDVCQHLVTVEPVVGRELLLGVLGLNPQSAEVLGQIERRLIADRARLGKLQQHFGPRHPDVVELSNAIREAEQYTRQYQQHVEERMSGFDHRQLARRLSSMLEQKLAKVQNLERELQLQYRACEAEAIRLNDEMTEATLVKNEVQRLQSLHDTLMNRIAGIDINQHRADVRVTIVSDPVAGESPVWPQLPLIGLLCLGGGLGIGLGAVYVLDLLDDRFRSPEEMQQQLDAPVLALIRDLPPLPPGATHRLHVAETPEAPESELFRTLRTALRFSHEGIDCLAVTSTEPGDGKTTILANLGTTYAHAGKRTLLVDADLRRPGLSRLFGLRGVHGLAELLAESGPVERMAEGLIVSSAIAGLDLLPSGPRPSDPAELLGNSRFAALLAWATGRYDQVLVDCPPMMAASDGAIVARQTDGALLVIQPAKNHRHHVLRAAARLRGLQAQVIGLAVNRVGDEPGSAYYGLADSYGYGCDERPDVDQEDDMPTRDADRGEGQSVVLRRRAA